MTTFNLALLQSRATLAAYFSQDPVIPSCDPPSPLLASLETLSPFQRVAYCIYGYFLRVISEIASCVGASALSRRCFVLSRHALHLLKIAEVWDKFHQDLLAPSINTHQIDSEDLYQQKEIPSPLADLSPFWKTGLSFYHPNGVCRGMADWFLYKYYQTYQAFSSEEQQMLAIGKLFEQGAPRQAALLQSFRPSSVEDLLHLSIEEEYHARQVSPFALAEHLQGLPSGTYAVYLSNHRINYIKTGGGEEFIFDPSIGCIKLKEPDNSLWLLKQTAQGQTLFNEVIVDRVS